MSNLAAIGLCLALQAQSDPPGEAHLFVEKLRSEKVEEREEAVRKLKELGKLALLELNKATQDSDEEVKTVARHLIRVINLKELFSHNLLKALPGLEERLAIGDDHEWTKALLEATATDHLGLSRYPDLRRWDLEVLVIPALRGAYDAEEKRAIDSLAGVLKSYSASPEIIKQVRDPKAGISAIVTLRDLNAWEAAPDLQAVINEADSWSPLRAIAMQVLGDLKVKEAVPRIIELSKNPDFSQTALQALGELQAREAIPAVIERLKDPSPSVCWTAARTLGRLGAKEGVPELVALLGAAKDPQLRAAAARTLGERGVTGAVPKIEQLLAETDVRVLEDASRALGLLGAKKALPKVVDLLSHEDSRVRRSALIAVNALSGKESVNVFRACLKDKDQWIRLTAAELLASWGNREGVPVILKESDLFINLNPLRCPGLWSNLAKMKIQRDRSEFSLREFISGISKQANLTIEGPKDSDVQFQARMSERWREKWDGTTTLIDGLMWFAQNSPYDLVLEHEQLRILSKSEAREFWRTWEQDEVRKMK